MLTFLLEVAELIKVDISDKDIFGGFFYFVFRGVEGL